MYNVCGVKYFKLLTTISHHGRFAVMVSYIELIVNNFTYLFLKGAINKMQHSTLKNDFAIELVA